MPPDQVSGALLGGSVMELLVVGMAGEDLRQKWVLLCMLQLDL